MKIRAAHRNPNEQYPNSYYIEYTPPARIKYSFFQRLKARLLNFWRSANFGA